MSKIQTNRNGVRVHGSGRPAGTPKFLFATLRSLGMHFPGPDRRIKKQFRSLQSEVRKPWSMW